MCRRGSCLSAALACCVLVAISSTASAFEFNEETSCVLLNNDNTDILTFPNDCSLPENISWCNCTRTALTNPIRGEASGLEQGIIWVTDEPGIGGHRIEATQGSVDLTQVEVGDVIGSALTHELVPESVGVAPGTFFTIRQEVVVTAKNGSVLDVEVVIVELSFIVRVILGYNPLDADHSDGRLYAGRLEARGPRDGFVFDYRYVAKDDASYPSIEPSDAGGPGFNARFVLSLFTEDGDGMYTFGENEDLLEVTTTLRKFTSAGDEVANPDEVLPLDAEDLCVVIEDPEPCRVFEEELLVRAPGAVNNPPEARIVVTDIQLQPLNNDLVLIDCGEGRVIFRGSNSTDGDDGSQGLTFLWEVIDEPEPGAAVIPAGTQTFMDTEISFLVPGDYAVMLTVDDGQPENHTHSAEAEIVADEGIGPNEPPEVFSLTYRLPDGQDINVLDENSLEAVLTGASLTIRFNADTATGLDGCLQEESFLWETEGPADVALSAAREDSTDATFTAAGEYAVRFTVDDGAPENNLAVVEIDVVIQGDGGSLGPFVRGDCNQAGAVDLSSAVFLLNFLFIGGSTPGCLAACDAAGSGQLEITSAVYLLNFLFLGGPAPPSPRTCALSANAGDIALGCEDPSGCAP